MGPQEVLDCMRFCAGRRLLMRSAWEAFMYRCCALRGVFSVHQQVQVIRVFASIRRREWAFLTYMLEGIRMQLQLLRLADAVLLLAALQRLRLQDELLLAALSPLCLKRIQITTTPPLLALLAHAAVRAGAPQLQELLQQIYVCMASRMQQQQQPQTISLLLAAYASYACKALGAPLLGAAQQQGGVSLSPFEAATDDVMPFKPFIQLLLDAAGNPKTLKQTHATDCMHLCIAAVNLQTAAAAAAAAARGEIEGEKEGLLTSAFKEALLRRVCDLMFEFSPWELAHLLPALVHLPAGLPLQQQQQQQQQPQQQQQEQQQEEGERGVGGLLLHRVLGLVLREMSVRAEAFNAETAAIALKALETLPEPAPITESALLVRLSQSLSRPLLSGVSRHLPVLQQVANRAALPSTLSLQPFLPALLPSSSSNSSSSISSSSSGDELLQQEEWTQPAVAAAAAALADTQQQQQQQQQQEQQLIMEEEDWAESSAKTTSADPAAAAAAAVGAAAVACGRRTPYRLPCSGAVGVPFASAIKAKDLSTQVASSVSSLFALLQLRDARWAFTLMRLSPQLSRVSSESSFLSLSQLTLSLAMLSMPKVVDELALFPLLSSRIHWSEAQGPLCILQAAALFDFTFKPKTLTTEMILPAAKALYLMEQQQQQGQAGVTASIQKRIESFLKELHEVKIHSNLCIGSWVYVDLAVDLQSLADHMKNQENTQNQMQHIKEEDILDMRGPPKREDNQGAPQGAPLNSDSSDVQQNEQFLVEGERMQVLGTDGEVEGEATKQLGCMYTEVPQHGFKEGDDCHQAATPTTTAAPIAATATTTATTTAAAEATGAAGATAAAATAEATAAATTAAEGPAGAGCLSYPPCYTFDPSGVPKSVSALSPSSHLLVFILLECFDFIATPSNLQKLGIHRKKETLLCPATRARLSAVRQWKWPVICLREKNWREAEALDLACSREGNGAVCVTHRKQLFLRLVADLAARGETDDSQEVEE
ncbi:hypothetical protein Emed_001139 [Eimeria media]